MKVFELFLYLALEVFYNLVTVRLKVVRVACYLLAGDVGRPFIKVCTGSLI